MDYVCVFVNHGIVKSHNRDTLLICVIVTQENSCYEIAPFITDTFTLCKKKGLRWFYLRDQPKSQHERKKFFFIPSKV